ncbi:MAG: TetR family transcriptional regulator [Bacteroidota bacterium]|nr:TetR family transcriptional regulator [Bacteroidota bacterium]MDQ6889693.1 TetR family transcriptional regulator [Bacteroidota bacterium]
MDAKETILSTAMKLFGQKGFEGTSVRDIAKEADVNLAMISYYFGSKEKLFENVVEYKASGIKLIFAELDKSSIPQIEKIDKIIDSYIERMFTNPQFHHLLHRELSLDQRPQMHNAITDILLRNVVTITSIIQKGMDAGEFKNVDAQLTIATLIGTINHLLISEAMCRKLLHKSKDFNPFKSKKLKERVSEHLKQLMRSHLLIKK